MATFNPVQSFGQGVALAGNIQQQQKQNQINALQQGLLGQIQQGGFDPSSSNDLTQLGVIDPARARTTIENFRALSDDRKKAYHEDLQEGLRALESGDGNRFLAVMSDRLSSIEKLKGDPTGTQFLLDKFNEGDINGLITGLKQAEQAGIAGGFLPDTTTPINKGVQSSKILDDGTVIFALKGGGRQVVSNTGEVLTGEDARNAVKTSNDAIQQRKIDLKNLDKKIKSAQAKEGVLTDQQKLLQKNNITRIGLLSDTASGRSAAIRKATKFKTALERGEAFSGAGRKAASFIPGVFTSQGQFDEEFNAFAEVAARQQLKASGETKPTDADVQGMKQAMFGLGRDEGVNIQLLTDFINEQSAQNNELDQLIGASKSGDLSSFTFTPQQTAKPAQTTTIGRFQVEVQ